jgi:hypothetical protein
VVFSLNLEHHSLFYFYNAEYGIVATFSAQTASPIVPTSTVLPISPSSCMAAVDCKAASQLALQHYTSVTGARRPKPP